jgi:hypothetical protein
MIKAKKGRDNKYLPTKNKKIIAIIETIIVENLKNDENVFDCTLAINHKKPYTVKKTIIPNNIKFINELYNTEAKKRNQCNKITWGRAD